LHGDHEEEPVTLPDDQEGRLRCYRKALRNEANRLVARNPDYVVFKKRSQEWLGGELPEYTLRDICRILHEYVESGGKVDEQVETRQEYVHWRFHFDLRIRFGGRHVYFETVLEFEDADDEDDLTIVVVNVKDV
jgi:hypothetical protein